MESLGLSPAGLDPSAAQGLAFLMNRLFFFGFGFIIWLLATVIFRAAGHLFFLDDSPAVLALIWIFSFVGLLGVSLYLFHRRRLNAAQRYQAAVLMVISGMILDAFATEGFAAVFPNMPASSAGSFGAWLLWAYASVLLAAILPLTRPPGSADAAPKSQAHK